MNSQEYEERQQGKWVWDGQHVQPCLYGYHMTSHLGGPVFLLVVLIASLSFALCLVPQSMACPPYHPYTSFDDLSTMLSEPFRVPSTL